MAFAERADLAARLLLKDDFSKPLTGAQKKLTGFGQSLKRTAKVAAAGVAAAVGTGALIVQRSVSAGIDSLATLEDAVTSVSGAISQRGLTKAISAQQIATWANEIESSVQAAFDDKDITQATTTLIRYGKVATTNIRPAMVVMTDLAAKTGDVGSASSLLAKVLADPAKAAGKLAKVGVVLTKDQQDQIAAMVKSGKTAKAQTYLLDALAKSTKGAAAAMHGPYRDSQLIFQDVVEDAQRALATGFLPVLQEVRTELADELAKPETLARIKRFGEGLAGGLKGLIGLIKGLDWNAIGGGLKAAGDGAHAIYDAFTGMPDWIKTAVLTGWGLNKISGGAVGDLISQGIKVTFGQFFQRGSSPANPMWVSSVGGVGGGAGGAAAGGWTKTGVGMLALGAVAIPEILSAVEDKIVLPKLQQQAGKNVQGTEAIIARGNATEIASALQGLQASTASLSGLQKVMYDLNANGVKTHTEGLEAALKAALAEALKSTEKNLQPLPEKITAKQKAHFDKLRDSAERNRISTTTRLDQAKAGLDRIRDRTEASRIAIVSGAHSDADRMIAAIRAARTVVNIAFSSTTVRRVSGSTVDWRYRDRKFVPET